MSEITREAFAVHVTGGYGIYRICQELNRGANARSYFALGVSGQYAGMPCVIKVFDNWSHPERVPSFKDEARYLETLQHPAILRVIDTGECSTDSAGADRLAPFHVTRYYSRTLIQKMRERFTMQEKLSYCCQLLSALQYLASQQRPILHRDIKPANIFLDEGGVVLGDFGLLVPLDVLERNRHDVVSRESVKGEMARDYPSIDLLRYADDGSAVTSKADVFQLGLVLAELFTSRPSVKWNKSGPSVTPLPPIGGLFGKKLRGIVNGMLYVDANARSSATTAVEALSELLADYYDAQMLLGGRLF